MNRNVPEPGNPVIVRKRNKKNDPGTGSGKTGMGTTNGRSKGMEQEHGTDAAAICKGVLLRVGMAAAQEGARGQQSRDRPFQPCVHVCFSFPAP